MKKLVSSVLVLCMIAVALAGCGNKSTETTKATEATASTEAAVSTEAVSETQAAEGEAATVQVYIAASLSNAMDEISANYKSVQPNVDLVFNAGSSGKLQTQIEEGGACDVFFSAATKQMNALVEGGYVQEDRIVKFAAQCVKTCALLPVKFIGSANFADQMFRSATSVAANYAEACEAESSKDFVHKLKIAMKELSETRVWLKLIGESGYIENAKLSDLIAESKELSRILSASVATTKKKIGG